MEGEAKRRKPFESQALAGAAAQAARDGEPLLEAMTALQTNQNLAEPWKLVADVEREIRLMAYTSAGDPKLVDDMRMYCLWAGRLQRALVEAGVVER